MEITLRNLNGIFSSKSYVELLKSLLAFEADITAFQGIILTLTVNYFLWLQ